MLEELFEAGQDHKEYILNGRKEEIQNISINYQKIDFTQGILEKIENLDKTIHLLAIGEMFCPDCQINLTVAHRITELNEKVTLKVISRREAAEALEFLNIQHHELRIPTILVLDKDFKELGRFVERPEYVKSNNIIVKDKFSYYRGEYMNHTALELLDFINRG